MGRAKPFQKIYGPAETSNRPIRPMYNRATVKAGRQFRLGLRTVRPTESSYRPSKWLAFVVDPP